MSSQIPINLPNRVRSGDPITAEWANAIRDCLQRLANRKFQSSAQSFSKDTVPPLWPKLGKNDDGTYVTVTPGCVSDVSTKSENCLSFFPIENLIAEDGTPAKFPISEGQCGYIKVQQGEDGKIQSESGPPVTFYVEADNEESTHYDPPIAEETGGSSGTYSYKLFKFNGEEAEKPFTMFMAGSNLQHFHELPTFKKAGGDYDIFKEYDSSEGKYKTKGLTASGPDYSGAEKNIEITSEENQLKIKVKGKNLDLEVYGLSEDTNGNIIQSTSPLHTLCWRNGVYVARVADGDTIPGHDGTKDVQAISKWNGS